MSPDTQSSPAQKKESRAIAVALVFVIIAVAVLAIIGFCLMREPAEILEGQADATSVRVSGKLPGRVAHIYVREGDIVSKGDTLVHIHSSLADAKLMQAKAMEDAAAAQNRKIDAGTRSQIITSAQELLAQATAARTLAEKTYRRMEALYKEQVVSEQRRDEAKAAYEATLAGEKAAAAQLSMARDGAQREDKLSAAAMVTVAQGGVDEVNALLEDQYLTAPCDGQIDQIYPQEGELISLGAPAMSILKVADKWIAFNVREDRLASMKQGDKITIALPALGMKEIQAEIYYIRDMGNYATWRATKATGDWDSRTFEVKARPLDSIPDLRPGMTAIYRP
ncbi:MAG: efflux RND transporter periplasmic adaptor subunit [Pseudoflavonifractor sp.]|nr:efflux RND transporter periplasmic adaptor subunit [Alloprevotella sp.]MCM1117221.1 efflux RND transporter periplasmic adaptor subunit [Pseudoflavonifractor sp.]